MILNFMKKLNKKSYTKNSIQLCLGILLCRLKRNKNWHEKDHILIIRNIK